MLEQPGQFFPVAIADFRFVDCIALFGAIDVERIVGDEMHHLFVAVRQVIDQRFTAAVDIADRFEEFTGVAIIAEQHRVHHATQTHMAMIAIQSFHDHRARELLRRHQQIDHRLFRRVVFADDGQQVFRRQRVERGDQGVIALSLSQADQSEFSTGNIAVADQICCFYY